ncbi:hypothetical protein BGW38_010846 [Lunasporangiospora selenospora]|uniref:Thioredoxin n=1 Tax=Lunasporangiospora selenospora TaxID=979761 RepID=A0A9P6FWL3_9FUNG|nr:hypothetical protein BGW38_010846 [Lunasporangiospora selenospora]
MAVKVTEIGTTKDFNTLIDSGKKVVVDFFADWCGPCKLISPRFEKLAAMEEYAGIEFIKVNVDTLAEVGEKAGIRAMPTFQAYKDGEKVGELTGAVPAKLDALVERLSKL